jgi:hypothetical protein
MVKLALFRSRAEIPGENATLLSSTSGRLAGDQATRRWFMAKAPQLYILQSNNLIRRVKRYARLTYHYCIEAVN